MTINLQHFDTKLKQDLEVREQIKNSLAEYLFPETKLALGMIYKDGTTAQDLEAYQGKTLQFASGERLYFASQSVRDLLYPNPSDGAAYGSLVFTPNISFNEKKNLRILIIDDSTGANGGLMPPDVAKKLVGDCYGKISSQLASELTGSSSTPFQFRIGIKPQAGNDVYRIAKGTLAPSRLDNLSELYFTNARNQSKQWPPPHSYDLILATSSFKGRKGESAIKPGEYNLTLGIGVKALAAYGKHSLGTQVLVNYPRGVQADILPTLEKPAINLAKTQSNLRGIAQLYIENYERRQQSNESFTEQLEVDSELAGLNTVIEESEGDEEINLGEQKKQDMLLYRLLKADLTGHAQLLEHPKVIDGLNKFVRKEWADIATGRAIKFNSGLAQPSWDLALNEICVPSIAEGKEVIVTRSPLVNSNGVIVLTNKHLTEAKNQLLTIHIHPETAAEHLQADFDGDRLAFEVATKYPTLAAEIKEYNLEKNRYPDVVKAKKVAYTGSFEEIALSARENKIKLIANQIQKAVALQWETQLIPAEKKPEYLNQIINYYKRLLKDDSNPSKNIQLDSQFRERIEKLANLPQQLTPQKVEQSLGEVQKLLKDVVSELSNELQVAVDGPKSAARPNETILNYCKAISEYALLGWLADKKNPEAFRNRAMNSTNYSPVDLMVQQANQLFNESRLTARPVVEFNPIFQGVAFTEKHSASAREISSQYNSKIRQAMALSERASQESGPSLIATSTASGKQIEITNLLKFDEPSSPVWTQSHLDIKLYPNTNKSLKNSLMAVVMTDSENKPIYQPIGTVSEESVKEHNLRTGIRLTQASLRLTPGATVNQVKAKFQEAAQYLDDVRQNTPENEQLPLAAAIWHVNHGRSEDSNKLKKASVAFKAFPDLVINQLSKLQFTNLTVVGVHQPTNDLLIRRWNKEKVQAAITLESDSNSPNHGKKIVVVDGKKFAPLSSESPSFPIGTKFEAIVFAPPGAAVIATTPKGNSLKVTQIKKHAFSNREWNGELTQIQVGFLPNIKSA